MARLPKVRLRAIPVFPTNVIEGAGIAVTKTNGIWTITLDVSDFHIANVTHGEENTTYAVALGSVTDDNPGGSYSLVPFSGFQGNSDDLTSLAQLATTGLVARIGDADFTTRTITAGAGIGITNGNGVAGNIIVAINDVELLALAGVTSAADRLFYFTGSGAGSLATFTAFGRSLVDDADAATARATLGLTSTATATPAALTKTDDTNVTLTLGGTPATALLQATSITVAWSGTLAAARLNSNVVQGVTNDTNITGTISAQNLTFAWSGTLAVARGGIGTGSASGTALDNITGFASTGILARTASGTYAFRTATGTANRLTVTNGDGVAGNHTFDISTSYVGQATITTLGTIATGTWSATTIAANKGGTGQTTYAVGDLLYADTTSTLAKLADIATNNVLISGGVGVAPSWGKVGNSALTNSTISGVALGGNLGTLTFGAHLISGGSSYNGSAGVTITSDATAVNTASTIMARDGSGQVAATTFTGALAGNATTATSAATLTTPRAIDGQNFDGSAAITVIAPGTHAATTKATPVDADELPLVDSAASNVLKKLTWANLKATLKTYFDTLYASLVTANTFLGNVTAPTFLSTLNPSSGAVLDTSGQAGVTANAGSSAIIASGAPSGLLFVIEQTSSGFSALFILSGGNQSVLVSQSNAGQYVAGTSPGSNYSVGYDGSNVRVYNGTASNHLFRAMFLKVA